MAYWLVEANDRSGALWGFLVEAERLSKPQVVDRLRAAGKAVEISGQIVDVRDLDFASLQVRHDPASMQTGGERFLYEGVAAEPAVETGNPRSE